MTSEPIHFHAVNMFNLVDLTMRSQKALKSSPQKVGRSIMDLCRAYEMYWRESGDFERAVHWQMVADYAEQQSRV